MGDPDLRRKGGLGRNDDDLATAISFDPVIQML